MKPARILGVVLLSTLFLAFNAVNILTPYPFLPVTGFPAMPVNTNNLVSVEGVQLGRFLFYDPILSSDSTISCASCHKQEFAFSDSPNRFSKGVTKTPLARNTMPLFNLAWYPSLFWDGRASSIEEQVFVPVTTHDEMNLSWYEAVNRINNSSFYSSKFKKVFGTDEVDSTQIAFAIAQFERTLISNSSKFDRVIGGTGFLDSLEYAGFVIINDQTKGDCLHCHTTDANAVGTTLGFSNNGLDSVWNITEFSDPGKGGVSLLTNEMGQFKIPSLRNVAITAPYMHDGRFNTLIEVLDFYSEGVNPNITIDSKMEFAHKGGANLTYEEKLSILAFLNTLTDSVFVSNPEFSNPFIVSE